jgi:TatD DNase family protein
MAANSSSNDKKKKPGFFSEITSSLNEVMNEVKADLKAMTPPSKEGAKKQAEFASREAELSSMLGEATSGLAEESIPGAPAQRTSSPARQQPEEEPQKPASKGLPVGNLWQALTDLSVTTRLHGDACFYALTTQDIDNYRKAITQEKVAPFTLGIVGVNLQAELEDETPETRADDLLLQALTKAMEEPRIYGAVGAGPRQVWPNLDHLDEHLTGLLNTYPKLIAVGPIGIDEPFAPYLLEQQQQQLALQLDLAADFGLPAILTHRGSLAHIVSVLEQAQTLPPLIWLPPLDTPEEAEVVKRFAMHAVLSPEITAPAFPREFIGQVPVEKLLLASGSALVAPHGFSGHFNQPRFLLNSIQSGARLLYEKDDSVLKTTNYNLAHLFNK